ncbi:conserved hypothetical protein, partial [Ricinus communis]
AIVLNARISRRYVSPEAKLVKPRTLPSQQRTRVLDSYRSRGRANSNLWLVYSVKTDRDWILTSDRHFVHWIAFLETNPDVQSFEIEPNENLARSGNQIVPGRIDATARLIDGTLEQHQIGTLDPDVISDQNPLQTGEGTCQPIVRKRFFMDDDLRPRALEAMRWLKVICYGATIRGEQQIQATLAAVGRMQSIGRGTIADIIDSISEFDDQVIFGVIARAAIKGDIALDLTADGFTRASNWVWRAIQ